MLFSYGYGQQQIGDNKKCRRIAGDFDCHADAAVRRGVHLPIEHIQGFTWCHWMPPSGECLRRIAPAAAMVDGFIETTLNTNKTQLLPSNYCTFRSLVVCENFNPKTEPLLSLSMRQASFKCEMPRLELKSSWSFLTPFPLFLVLTYCHVASRKWLERHSIDLMRVKIRVMKDAHTRIFPL